MKKYLLGVFAIGAAISFSSFRALLPNVTFVPANLTTANVILSSSYADTPPLSCPAPKVDPCIIDLSAATISLSNAADFHAYISDDSRFPSLQSKLDEVNRLTVDRKP